MPDNNYNNKFRVINNKINKEVSYDLTFTFSSNLKNPVKEQSGTDWYGEPIYKITGYQNSDSALLAEIEFEIKLTGKSLSKTKVICSAIYEKLVMIGFRGYTKTIKKEDANFVSNGFIIVLESESNWIKIRIYNNNNEGFRDGLIKIIETNKFLETL